MMKKIILGLALVFIMNFGLKALAQQQIGEQLGCESYCDSVEKCCIKNSKNVKDEGRGIENCVGSYGKCIITHKIRPSDQCPKIESCD